MTFIADRVKPLTEAATERIVRCVTTPVDHEVLGLLMGVEQAMERAVGPEQVHFALINDHAYEFVSAEEWERRDL